MSRPPSLFGPDLRLAAKLTIPPAALCLSAAISRSHSHLHRATRASTPPEPRNPVGLVDRHRPPCPHTRSGSFPRGPIHAGQLNPAGNRNYFDADDRASPVT